MQFAAIQYAFHKNILPIRLHILNGKLLSTYCRKQTYQKIEGYAVAKG